MSLLPRIRKRFPDARTSDATIRMWLRRAIGGVAQASPVFGTALPSLWCDAWATSHRKGMGADSCLFCGRCRGDRLPHLVRCRPLWTAVSQATGFATPRSLLSALGLNASAVAPSGGRTAKVRSTAGAMSIAVVSDVYHKIRARRRMGSQAPRAISKRQVDAAVRHALRRLWRL